MKSGGKDDFQRDPIRFDPPDPPLVVNAFRSGVRGLDEVERDTAEPSGPSHEALMNAPAHREEKAVTAVTFSPEGESAEAERERGEVAATVTRTSASSTRPASPSPPDAPADPSQQPQEASGAPAGGNGAERTNPDATELPEAVIEGSPAEVVGPLPSISEIAAATAYLEDDPEDDRRCARDERRCVQKASDGRRCRSYAMRGQTACAGHSGKGLAASPTEHASLSHASRRDLKLQRQMVAPGGKFGVRAALKLETLRRGAALADHAVTQALAAEGLHGVASVVKLLDAVDPLVTVETTTSTGVELGQRLMAGEEVPFRELERVYGDKAQEPAQTELPA